MRVWVIGIKVAYYCRWHSYALFTPQEGYLDQIGTIPSMAKAVSLRAPGLRKVFFALRLLGLLRFLNSVWGGSAWLTS